MPRGALKEFPVFLVATSVTPIPAVFIVPTAEEINILSAVRFEVLAVLLAIAAVFKFCCVVKAVILPVFVVIFVVLVVIFPVFVAC